MVRICAAMNRLRPPSRTIVACRNVTLALTKSIPTESVRLGAAIGLCELGRRGGPESVRPVVRCDSSALPGRFSWGEAKVRLVLWVSIEGVAAVGATSGMASAKRVSIHLQAAVAAVIASAEAAVVTGLAAAVRAAATVAAVIAVVTEVVVTVVVTSKAAIREHA